jgi:hypothetical protein
MIDGEFLHYSPLNHLIMIIASINQGKRIQRSVLLSILHYHVEGHAQFRSHHLSQPMFRSEANVGGG